LFLADIFERDINQSVICTLCLSPEVPFGNAVRLKFVALSKMKNEPKSSI